MKNKIVVVVAHPDDEVLGCGGTIIKHIKKGDTVFSLILSGGITSREDYNKDELKELHENCQVAGKIMGVKEIFLFNFPDNKFDSVPLLNIVKKIEEFLEKLNPDIIYTHHGGDVNIDHRLTYEAVMTACRPCNPYCPEKIYSFETLSSTEWQLNNGRVFMPNVYINTEREIEDKIKAMRQYKTEMRNEFKEKDAGIITLRINMLKQKGYTEHKWRKIYDTRNSKKRIHQSV